MSLEYKVDDPELDGHKWEYIADVDMSAGGEFSVLGLEVVVYFEDGDLGTPLNIYGQENEVHKEWEDRFLELFDVTPKEYAERFSEAYGYEHVSALDQAADQLHDFSLAVGRK